MTGFKRALRCAIQLGVVWAVASTSQAQSTVAAPLAPQFSEAGLHISRLGFTDNTKPRLRGPALYLKGDGPPDLESFAEFAKRVSADPVDVVVLGASYPDYEGECMRLNTLPQVNSCTTVVIRDPQAAQSPQAVAAVKGAELVYFRGGDQCNFVQWKDSPLLAAVKDVVMRGGGTGGGSAGLAIQGSLAVYDGCNGSARSTGALKNPFQNNVSFSPSLFAWPYLDDMLMDSHFVKRDRMGRLMAFLCRQLGDGRIEAAWGLGINDDTAVLVDRQGQATVFGDTAYLVEADRPGAGCQPSGEPLTYAGYKVWRLDAGQHYDFAHRPRSGFYRVDVEQGVIQRDPYQVPTGSAALANAGRSPDRLGGL